MLAAATNVPMAYCPNPPSEISRNSVAWPVVPGSGVATIPPSFNTIPFSMATLTLSACQSWI